MRTRIASLAMIVAALSGAATVVFQRLIARPGYQREIWIEQLDCPSNFGKFRNSVVYRDARSRVRFEADSGCGTKQQYRFDLKNVVLTISNGSEDRIQLHADEGTFSRERNELILGPTKSLLSKACFGEPEVLLLNLTTGELRAPGRRVLLKQEREIPCKG